MWPLLAIDIAATQNMGCGASSSSSVNKTEESELPTTKPATCDQREKIDDKESQQASG